MAAICPRAAFRPGIRARLRRPVSSSALSRPVQIYHSPSSDPFLNLSIEHHVLQHSHPDSTVLFLYRNRPCVVIGRNQNPWLEVNLASLRRGLPLPSRSLAEQIDLVRRRSGGGTVFHDLGNINWSVICPPALFDRNRHALMVTRALRYLGVADVRVNERHDIVVDSYDSSSGPVTHKVSGSAYKLTRLRSLHHGTCLLSSPNLRRISGLLRSPAEGFIKARGVESVRSPIRNVGVEVEDFVDAVTKEFRDMYGAVKEVVVDADEARATDGVVKGLRELESPEWIFGQTPQFTFSTHPTEDDPRLRSLPEGVSEFRSHLTIRHGEIQSADFHGLRYADDVDVASQDQALSRALINTRIHHITDWRRTLSAASTIPILDNQQIGTWLNAMFGLDAAA